MKKFNEAIIKTRYSLIDAKSLINFSLTIDISAIMTKKFLSIFDLFQNKKKSFFLLLKRVFGTNIDFVYISLS